MALQPRNPAIASTFSTCSFADNREKVMDVLG
jgi:hypothetical protein